MLINLKRRLKSSLFTVHSELEGGIMIFNFEKLDVYKETKCDTFVKRINALKISIREQ